MDRDQSALTGYTTELIDYARYHGWTITWVCRFLGIRETHDRTNDLLLGCRWMQKVDPEGAPFGLQSC